MDRSGTQGYIFKILLLDFALVLTNTIVIFIFAFVRFTPDAWAYCSIAGSIPATVYTLGHACNYLIFLQRSQVYGPNEPEYVTYIRQFAKLGTYSMIAFGLLIGIVLRGKLLPDYICVEIYPWWVSAAILIADGLLSSVFLLLFIIPVRDHAKMFRDHRNVSRISNKLIEIARKNLFWSSITICTTFFFLLTLSVIRFATELDHRESPNHYSYYLIDWCFAPVDLVINTFAAVKITEAVWRPKSARPVRPDITRFRTLESLTQMTDE